MEKAFETWILSKTVKTLVKIDKNMELYLLQMQKIEKNRKKLLQFLCNRSIFNAMKYANEVQKNANNTKTKTRGISQWRVTGKESIGKLILIFFRNWARY